MRRLLLVAGLVVGSITLVAPSVALTSGPPKSGNNPPNTYGLCTAANNGEKNGWNSMPNGVAPPFQGLAAQGGSSESDPSGNNTDGRADALLACQNDGVTPGGQGHGSPGAS